MSDLRIRKIMDLRSRGFSYDAVAAEMGVTKGVVAGAIYREGATKDTSKCGKAFPLSVRRQVAALKGNGWKQHAIAVALGISVSTVSAYSRGLGVYK